MEVHVYEPRERRFLSDLRALPEAEALQREPALLLLLRLVELLPPREHIWHHQYAPEVRTAASLREILAGLEACRPATAEGWHVAGEAHGWLQEPGKAVLQYRRALLLRPSQLNTLHDLCRCEQLLERHAEALQLAERLCELAPEQAEGHRLRGRGLACLERAAEAEASLRRAMELDARCWGARYNLAQLLHWTGRTREALALARQAAELRPELALAHELCGDLLRALKRPHLAFQAYQRAVRTAPRSFRLLQRCVRVLLRELAQPEHALELLEDYEPVAEELADHWGWKASSLYGCGRCRDALQAIEQALLIDASKPEYHVRRGMILSGLERAREALQAFACAIRIAPGHAPAHYQTALALGSLKRYPESARAYLRAAAFDAERTAALYNAACQYALGTDPEKAWEWLQKAVAADAEFKDLARADEDFEILRSHPEYSERFHALVGADRS